MIFLRFCLIILFFFAEGTRAEETDQFTLPPTELKDLGAIASQRLAETIQAIIDTTNREIQELLPRARVSSLAKRKLARRLSGVYLANMIYQKSGPGFPRWLKPYPSIDKAMQYREPRPWKNVYWLMFSQSPLSYIELGPTISMFGHYLGTDKLGHFFMQGHTYFKIYTYLLAHGKTVSEAQKAIVLYGKLIEYTYLGSLVNGTYSNADLSANYAGWKFYLNLTEIVKIGEHNISPILVLKNNRWSFSEKRSKDELLKPYISDNLNEALNTSHYVFMRSILRRNVKKRCKSWFKQRGLTSEYLSKKLKETELWYGEDYGHWMPKGHKVGLEVCFNN